jgi:tetratricopeptide (TPR) repeat protein
MIEAAVLHDECFFTTDGDIAIVNLNSARLRSWGRLFQDPKSSGVAEAVLEAEQLTAQFAGDVMALDRLESLATLLARSDASSSRTALIEAQIASMLHRFAEARGHLERARLGGAPSADVERLRLNIDQACGASPDAALKERRAVAENSGRLEDLVALGALLVDLGQFSEADEAYRQALRQYRDVSPFPVAWASFQLGVLWGELADEPQLARAEHWYRNAVACLPCYVKARVHLAEILASDGRTGEAEATLAPALASGDPEVYWRLADVLTVEGRHAEAEAALEMARSGFEALLEKYLLAFADHGAEFYAGSGDNAPRALELAQINLANRPTVRAFEDAYRMAVNAAEIAIADEILGAAANHWGGTAAFRLSSLARARGIETEGVPTW